MRKEPFLYITAFGVDGSFAAMGICIPLLALHLGGTYYDLGAIAAIGSLTYSLGCLVAGRLSDRVGYRRSITATSLALSLVFFSYLLVDRIGHLILLAGITGVVISGLWPPMQAWLGQGKDRGALLRTLGNYNVSWSLGFLVGPVVGGTLYAIDPQGTFALNGALVGVAFLALVLVKVREAEPAAPAVSKPASFPAARRFLPIAWTANFTAFFATGAARALFPKLATDLDIAPGTLGYLLALIGLAQLATFLLVSRTDQWQFRWLPLAAAQLLVLTSLGVLVFGKTAEVFAAGFLVHGVGIGVTFISSIFYSLHTEGAAGRRTGFHEAIIGSGFFLGPLVGGFAAEHLGSRSPYLLAAGIVGGGLAVQFYLLKKRS